ncbi:MAG: serine/threonine protein kinase [Myxococcota bacterium]|nr:serine/threonine protein kinase [Myxococcota bacterium]
MNRRSFPTGQASTAMLKALLRVLVAEKGASVADSWLRGIRMVRDHLDDETRMLPLPTLHHALLTFAELASRDAIPRATKYLTEPDNLGVWVRVLRGTTAPAEAFGRLDAADSEYGRTTRWETLATKRGWWHGRVSIAHDPALEADGLLRLARVAELAAVPTLFGWSKAVARERTEGAAAGPGLVQEYEVDWSAPDATLGGVLGAVIGMAAGATSLLVHPASKAIDVVMMIVAGLAGGFIGTMSTRDRLRRAETATQALRVVALERSLSLKESRERDVPGQLEGMVAAGQYRLVRRMGSGATGVIYEAVRIADGLPVALKLLRAAAAHEAVASDRLRREAEALGLAWHPNVVEVIDQGHLPDGTAYLVMELLHGESLAARLGSKGHLTPVELLPIAMQVCDALAAVHAAGVVHRDVKPSNIFLAADRDDPSGPERAKLLDFGIARVEWEETRITNTGGPLGTPGYMSPEQEIGSGEVDGRSDIFALGAVLYECLVGEPPPSQSPSGLVRTGENVAVRFDSGTLKASPMVAPAWYAVIEKAMAPSPADRYQDARSFAQALRGVRDEIVKAGAST